MKIRLILALLGALTLLASGDFAPASAQPAIRVETANPQFAGEVQLPVGKSRIIRVDRPITEVLVGNPEVADVMALSDRAVYVLAKATGATNLILYGDNRNLVSVIDLTVTQDLPTLRRRLHEVMPSERIEVRAANDAVVLSGSVTSADHLKRALSLAENYAPGKITNMLTLSGGQQVMLAVRFAEVQRTVAKQLGFNTALVAGQGTDFFAFASNPVSVLESIASLGGSVVSGNVAIDVLLDALEEKGVVKTLAEPNLIAMSGETASFLAGGEYPIPVGRDFDSGRYEITIEFKEFGVKLAFTPTVVGDGTINLLVEPEVSAIDPSTSIVLNDLVIPGLSTRRAHTTVDLRHGESFAIAGLIQSNFKDSVSQFPGLGDIPILGTLLRSSAFQREETELVIIVTPYLVRPALPGQLRLPTDTVVPPKELELFFLGKVEGRQPLPGQPATGGASAMPPGAGLAGDVGHVYW